MNVGLLGIGTVGGGTFTVLQRNTEEITRRAGRPIRITVVADRDLALAKKVTGGACRVTDDAFAVVSDPEVDIVVELIGGYGVAKDLVLKAIANGKHVVTANKALIATEGKEIFDAAEKRRVEVGLEAAVAGSIPVIKIIREALVGNKIEALYGIINGTSNYILSKMTEEGVDFSAALDDAKALGYAEADPKFDIEGIDSAHKLAILLSLSFGAPFSFSKIYTEGITEITPLDIQFASEFGYKIKLLAIAKLIDSEIEARVHPTMLPDDSLISNVNGVFNAVYVEGDAIGQALYYGKGAGEMPTGSAIVSDIVDIARNIRSGAAERIHGLGMPVNKRLSIRKMEDISSCYYLRFSAIDKPGVLSRISGILGGCNISIKSVIQNDRKKEKAVPLVMMTHKAREKDIVLALKKIKKLSVVSGKTLFIRVEDKDEYIK